MASTTACVVCGIESDQSEFFRWKAPAFGKKARAFCPLCAVGEEDKVYLYTALAFASTLIAGIAFLVFLPSLSIGPMFLNLALLQLFIFATTIFHELGHAWAGQLVGARVFGIEIGYGRVVSEFVFGGLRWEFRSVLLGGCTHGSAKNTNYYKLRQSLFILGGPLVDIVLIVVAIFALPLDAMIDETFFHGCAPALMLLVCNVALLTYSVWPKRYPSRYGLIPNDILLLWETLRQRKSEIKDIAAVWYYREGEEHQKRSEYDAAAKWIKEGLQQFPRNFYLEVLEADNLMQLKKHDLARRAFVRLLGRYGKHKDLRFTFFNSIAWGNVQSRNKELLHEADLCSQLASESSPQNFYYKGTRGAVLVELGQISEGLKLVCEALRHHTERRTRALDACVAARAEEHLGKLDESRQFLALARKLDPKCPALETTQ